MAANRSSEYHFLTEFDDAPLNCISVEPPSRRSMVRPSQDSLKKTHRWSAGAPNLRSGHSGKGRRSYLSCASLHHAPNRLINVPDCVMKYLRATLPVANRSRWVAGAGLSERSSVTDSWASQGACGKNDLVTRLSNTGSKEQDISMP
jgi:hypothetical protein